MCWSPQLRFEPCSLPAAPHQNVPVLLVIAIQLPQGIEVLTLIHTNQFHQSEMDMCRTLAPSQCERWDRKQVIENRYLHGFKTVMTMVGYFKVILFSKTYLIKRYGHDGQLSKYILESM